jgi:hypothetical protein
MSYLILAMMLMALWHWVYESLVAPSLRQSLRLELWWLHQELLDLVAAEADASRHEPLQMLGESVCVLDLLLEKFDAVTVASVAVELRRDPALRARAEARGRILDGSASAVVRRVRQRTLDVAARAVVINSGGWCIFIVPFALVHVGMRRLGRVIAASVSLSNGELRRIMMTGSVATPPRGTL